MLHHVLYLSLSLKIAFSFGMEVLHVEENKVVSQVFSHSRCYERYLVRSENFTKMLAQW